MSKGLIRLFDVCRNGTHTLGPGLRYTIWVQGCLRHCKGCITPESQPLTNGIEIDTYSLAADILEHHAIDGITISGGEPFLQAIELSNLLNYVLQKKPELTVIVYTGYKLEELSNITGANELLSQIDILIDGEYIDELNDGKGIRGSSNQRIIPISHRLDCFIRVIESGKRSQERIASNDRFYSTIGLPRLNNE